jgi:nucleotidyltransferase/DNA polymerase involved in DNA repair
VPAVVSLAGGNGGEIASANYVAREFGIRAGMWMHAARECCPDVIALPYDFQGIRAVSEKLYRFICEVCRASLAGVTGGRPSCRAVMLSRVQLTSHVQPVSCDESYFELPAFVDVPAVVATLRRRVQAETGDGQESGECFFVLAFLSATS